MPLMLVTGRAGSGKTGAVYQALTDAAAAGREAVLLLPGGADVRRAVDELAGRAVTGIRVGRFDRYLDELWGLHGDGRGIVGPLQRELLVARAVDTVGASGADASAGTVRLVSAVAASGSRVEAGDPFGDRLRPILREYERLLAERGLLERNEAHGLVADSLPSDVESVVAVHRFTSLSPSQLDFLAAAAASGRDVWVSLTWEEAFPPTAALDPLADRLRGMAVELETGSQPRHFASPELARLEARLFQGPDPQPSLGHVTLLLSTGDEAECGAIAARVRSWIGEGIAPERIAVVFRDPLRRLEVLAGSFRAAGVEADIDVPVPLGRTPFGRALRLLADALLRGDPRSLSAFLTSAFSGMAEPQATALDRAWRMARASDPAELLVQVAEKDRACGELLSRAAALLGVPVTDGTAGDWAGLLDSLLANAHKAGHAPRETFAAHSAALGALEEVAGSGEGLDAAAFLERLDRVSVPAAPAENTGRVQILSASGARSLRFDAVVIGGLVAGEFPLPVDDGGGPEGVASRLRRAAGLGKTLAEERLLFYQVASSARCRLALSRQEADADGTPLAASVFWDEVLDLYRDDNDAAALPPAERTTGLGDGDGARPRDALRAAAANLDETAPPRVREAASRHGARQEELDAGAAAALAERAVFSASEIETYVGCPYRWFYSRLLHPETIDAELGPREAGTLAHAVLHRFYAEWATRSGKARLEPGDEKDAARLLDEVFAAERGSLAVRGLAEEHEVLRLRRRLGDFVRTECEMLPGYEPVRLEWSFAEQDGIDLGGFMLSGRIDRIDAGPEGIVVVDYKSGQATKVADFGKFGVMQLQLYASAARALLKDDVAAGLYRSIRDADARGFYVTGAISGPKLKRTDAMSRDEVDGLLEESVSAAVRAVTGMRSGRIPAEPVCPDRCGRCPAYGVCARTVG